MRRSKRVLTLAFACFLAAALALLAGASLQYRELLESAAAGVRAVPSVRYETADERSGTLALPGKLTGLAPRPPGLPL